ncbi:MAG: GGDEF domain-containing protein [Phycisphaerae bacterium]|nr:GGDEF domain-containing protein [Phycisphaerae bacterium]
MATESGRQICDSQDLLALSREHLVELVGQLRHKLAEITEQVETQKITDSLTGLANRDYFFASLTRLCNRAKRFGQTICMMLIDVDDFHVVNEQHGNLAGDLVLTGIADVLRAVLRDYDLLARFGDDEFAVAIDNGDPAIAKLLCRRIRNAIAQNPPCLGDRSTAISVTIGIVTARSELVAERPDAMVRAAIEAIDSARQKGRNQTHWMDLTEVQPPVPQATE